MRIELLGGALDGSSWAVPSGHRYVVITHARVEWPEYDRLRYYDTGYSNRRGEPIFQLRSQP